MQFPQFRWTKTDNSLEARVKELERELKSLRVEWDEWYDKYRRLYARLSKRVEAAQNDDSGNDRGGEAPLPDWLARMDPVSQDIWKRRLGK